MGFIDFHGEVSRELLHESVSRECSLKMDEISERNLLYFTGTFTNPFTRTFTNPAIEQSFPFNMVVIWTCWCARLDYVTSSSNSHFVLAFFEALHIKSEVLDLEPLHLNHSQTLFLVWKSFGTANGTANLIMHHMHLCHGKWPAIGQGIRPRPRSPQSLCAEKDNK